MTVLNSYSGGKDTTLPRLEDSYKKHPCKEIWPDGYKPRCVGRNCMERDFNTKQTKDNEDE